MRAGFVVVIMLASCMPATIAASGEAGETVNQGSSTVIVGGRKATRSGDKAGAQGTVVSGSSNVFIGGKPAARTGDRTDCGGTIVGGSSNVFINGKPMAAVGDRVKKC